ncbi:hypothetical protein [Lutibacter sp.]|uniref:hypothetical protein n=1 Tax=Lutibacter sp. TaxID=1925666 RepID=UPI002733CD9B|nr:hypothetical protein [Lutibacter sp.]MDP3314383.1 hypothetical protein [Lutibacter sp.]
MGSQVKVSCKCGLNKSILIGGGMESSSYECFFPCFCKNCSDVVEVNLLDLNPKCPECGEENIIAFDNRLLIGEKGKQVIESWHAFELGRELLLTNGTYKCPKCNTQNLRFSMGDLYWD